MGNISRRSVVAGAASVAALGVHATAQATPARPPNILFIMADDLGYADLSCYGRRDYSTPNIDRLAQQGMRFEQAYANSSVCSPTRVALMTGCYQYRLPVGLEEPLQTAPLGLPPEEPTLPRLLKQRGYNTALIGKWHLGQLPNYGPLQSGYDHFWGFRGGGVDYFTYEDPVGAHDLWDGDVHVETEGYLTDLLGDRAITQLEAFADADAPFLLSLHFSAPHWPWEGPSDQAVASDLGARTEPLALLHYDGGSLAVYAAMVERLDMQVGRVLAALRRLRLERNTIVVFTSDNGGERFSDTWPLSGRKGELLEGGIRVPAIVRWPEQVSARQVSQNVIITMDWLPTLLAAAGAPAHATDGVNIGDAFRGGELAERALFWRFNTHGQEAVRRGNWKYLQIGASTYLFDLSRDPLERANLKRVYPEVFEELRCAYASWNATMLSQAPLRQRPRLQDPLADRYSHN